MFERREQMQRWFNQVVEKFRQKGAVTPDKAMTTEELGLPPRFEEAMKRRLGRLGVFVEVNGKYYLSEERLKQVEDLRSARGGAWNPRSRIVTLRLLQLVTIVFFIALFLANLFYPSWQLKVVSVGLLVVWLVIAMLQIYFLSRIRRRYSSQQPS